MARTGRVTAGNWRAVLAAVSASSFANDSAVTGDPDEANTPAQTLQVVEEDKYGSQKVSMGADVTLLYELKGGEGVSIHFNRSPWLQESMSQSLNNGQELCLHGGGMIGHPPARCVLPAVHGRTSPAGGGPHRVVALVGWGPS